jgi:hypothetical protein
MFDWLKIKSTLAQARDECKGMRATIANNKLRIGELMNLRPPREELADTIATFIDAAGSVYPQHLSASLQHFVRNPIHNPNAPINPDAGTPHPLRVLTATDHSTVGATPKTIETALFYLMGDQLKAAVRKAVQEMEYPAIVGPAMPKRRAEIDKLTKENAGLEAKVNALEEELAQTVS